MLRTMSELERAVNDLLGRLKSRPGTPGEWERASGLKSEESASSKEGEAAELIRRAIKRLKSL
jgi:hypothetical protein